MFSDRSHPMELPQIVRKTVETLLGTLGLSAPALRRTVFQQTRTGAGETSALQPDELGSLVKKIDQHPWLVGDDDFLKLRQAGYSEDQIFELAVAAAAGAGVRRFEAGLRAIAAAGTEITDSRHPDREFTIPQADNAEDKPAGGL